VAQSLSHPEERTTRPAADRPGHASDPRHHHVPGSMNISAQERMFESFMRLVTRAAIAIVVILLLLALLNG
jgi:hypothetical protein